MRPKFVLFLVFPLVVGPLTVFAQPPFPPLGSLAGRVAALEAQVEFLQGALAAERAARSTADGQLQAALTALQGNSVLALDGKLTLDTSSGNPTALFTGVNVQVVNGLGSTETVNSLGNLIVGYNEMRGSFDLECSYGPATGDCVAQGYILGMNHKSGSHNVVVGASQNYSWYGGLVTGLTNSILAPGTAVIGGDVNRALHHGSVVISGGDNQARSVKSVVVGGAFNITGLGGNFATVTGGHHNHASNEHDSVAGGAYNEASGGAAGVVGGSHNTASGSGSSISGGTYNTASGAVSSVSGGHGCTEARDHGWSVGDTSTGTTGCATGN